VRYADTDAMGIVYHANYLAFFEVGRVETMRQIGADYASVVARGLHLVVIEAHARYVNPAKFDDVLLVHTALSDIGVARFSFGYRAVREGDGLLIATGQTVHACVDMAKGRPIRLPAWLVDDLQRLR
jgi:acyl-CoA thioester hydrolase